MGEQLSPTLGRGPRDCRQQPLVLNPYAWAWGRPRSFSCAHSCEVDTLHFFVPPLPRFSHFRPVYLPHAPFRLVPWGTNRGGVWRRGSVALLNLRSFRCFRAGPRCAEARTGEALAIQPCMRHSYLVSFALLWVWWDGTVAADVITPGWIALAAAAPPADPFISISAFAFVIFAFSLLWCDLSAPESGSVWRTLPEGECGN